MPSTGVPFPLQQALLAWHASRGHGYPRSDLKNWELDPVLKKPVFDKYVEWIARNLAVSQDAAKRYFTGSRNIPAGQASVLLTALGGDADHLPVVHKQHAQWEVSVALCLEASPSLYSPQLDKMRARLGIDTHLRALISPASLPTKSTTGAAAPAAGFLGTADPSDQRRRQFNSALGKLDDPVCALFVHMLARECNSGLAEGPQKPTRTEIEAVLQQLRGLASLYRVEPIDAVCRALNELTKRREREITPNGVGECIDAAKAVFSLCLMDYAIALSAVLAEGDLPLVYAPVSDLLGAALLLDEAVGYDTHFTRVEGEGSDTQAALRIQVEGYLTEARMPGILPGGHEQTLRNDIQSRLLVSLEMRDKTGFAYSRADGARLSNKQQRSALQRLARQRREPLRFSVDMAHPDAAYRLDFAKRLSEDIGIPVIAFGGEPHSATDAAVVGALYEELESLDVLIASFLAALKGLQTQAA
jgi:hypothetical protein